MGRSPCSTEKAGLKKGPWTPAEDQKLVAYIEQHGHGSWHALPSKAGLKRCGKSCRLRWNNYLRPDIKRGKFSLQEERTIIRLHALLGNRWSAIAAHLPKRTDNEIKNYWNTHLKKRLTRMGIDPTTHRPKVDALGSASSSQSNLRHTAQWESARLEAEARQVRDSNFQLCSSSFSSAQPARLVLNKVSARPLLPPCLDVLKAWQNSWSLPTDKDKNTRMHDMYALMLADADDDLASPASILSFPEPMLPSSSTKVGLPSENALNPPATVVNSTATPAAAESWEFSTEENQYTDIGERRMTSLRDDDIMAAVEAFMAVRYEKVPEGPSSNSVMEGLNSEDNDVYESNYKNLASGADSLGFINVRDRSMFCINKDLP